ncbi:MAG: hypothetical protein AB1894_22765 [Chloroflexota bacterium]
MEQYWIEGIFLTKQGVAKQKKSGKRSPAYIEPFSKSFWANNAEEAVRLATEALQGGEWLETPRVSKTSEEQRMRFMGAPELPGFGAPKKKRKEQR